MGWKKLILEVLIIVIVFSTILAGLGIAGLLCIPVEKPSLIHHGLSILRVGHGYYLMSMYEYIVPGYRFIPGFKLYVNLSITIQDPHGVIDNRSSIVLLYGYVRSGYLRSLSFYEGEGVFLETLLSSMNRSVIVNNSYTGYISIGGHRYFTLIILIPLKPYALAYISRYVPPLIYYPFKIPGKMLLIELINESSSDKVFEHVLRYYLVETIDKNIDVEITPYTKINIGIDTYLRITGAIIIALTLYIQTKYRKQHTV